MVPLELDEVYPLSQHEAAHPLDCETIDYVANQTAEYIKRSTYKSVVLLNNPKYWSDNVKKTCMKTCKTADVHFDSVDANLQGSREVFNRLESILRKQLNEKN